MVILRSTYRNICSLVSTDNTSFAALDGTTKQKSFYFTNAWSKNWFISPSANKLCLSKSTYYRLILRRTACLNKFTRLDYCEFGAKYFILSSGWWKVLSSPTISITLGTAVLPSATSPPATVLPVEPVNDVWCSSKICCTIKNGFLTGYLCTRNAEEVNLNFWRDFKTAI